MTLDRVNASEPGTQAAPRTALDPVLRAQMEARFDYDFSGVRIHIDNDAAQSAKEIGATAYTIGRDIVFGPGAYAPASSAGRRLIAHELAHVVQQGGRPAAAAWWHAPSATPAPPDRFEAAADRAATVATALRPSEPARPIALSAGTIGVPGIVQRQRAGAAGAQQDIREQIIELAEAGDAASRQRALDLIISTYYGRPENFDGIFYDPNLRSQSPQDAETGPAPGQPQFGGRQRTTIGPRFFNNFRSRYDQRVRTIGHELQHVGQRSPPGGRTVLSTFAGAGVGALIGGGIGAGIAALAGASLLGGGIIGGVVGGVIGGIVDPFGRRDEPIQNQNTREFLAIHWVLTAEVRGVRPLPRGQALQNINQPGEGAIDRYRRMPPEDQRRYRHQYEEILRIRDRLEREGAGARTEDEASPEMPASASGARLA
jgi:hypothetical protein